MNVRARVGAVWRSSLSPPSWRVLALVWIVSALYTGRGLGRGWIPHDDGMLAESAERVLEGELPHRDFDEVYTGGLSYANAAAFSALGTNLFSLRLLLFAVFLAWVPALYYVATRFAQPVVAGLVTSLGVAWSLPTYSAAMPSWYNLFLATFGTAAVLRHLETGQQRWLLAAGIAGGFSCLAKIVGLYYVAGVLLFFVFRERVLFAPQPPRPVARFEWYPLVLGAALLCFVGLLVWLVHTRFGVAEVVHFVLPGAALAAFVYHEAVTADGGGWERLMALSRLVLPFLVGLTIPIAVFLIPYLRSGSVSALWSGVFFAPAGRLRVAARNLPGAPYLLAALPVALLLGILPLRRVPARRLVLAILILALLVFLILSKHGVWYTIRPLLPLTVLAGIWVLAGARGGLSPLRRQQVLLTLSVTAMCSLIQFPWEGSTYFFYVAPLAALSVLAVVASQPRGSGAVPGTVLGVYLLFAVVNTHPSREPTGRLALQRGGGIIVPSRDKVRYESIAALLQAHASGSYTYAGRDCPEVYFLAGLRNPTRTIFEFLGDSAGQSRRILRTVDDHRVTAVVINRRPPFSGPLPPDLLDSLATRYPGQDSVDQFVVRWRP